MIRFLLRTLGMLFLAAAFVFLVYDGTISIGASQLQYTTVGSVWEQVHATSLQQLQPWIESRAGHWLWDQVVTKVLAAPVAAALALLGAIMIPLGRRRKPLIGYAR
jgi:hypothetical protein